MTDFNDEIKKYLKGELSPKERHALEQKALSDPFLADALEGAEYVTPGEFIRDLEGLNEKILSKKKQRFTMSWRIAAGVAAIGTTVLLVLLIPRKKPDDVAMQKNSETEATADAPREERAKEIKDSISLQPDLSYLPPSPVVTQGPVGSSRLGSGVKPTETKDALIVLKDSTLIAASDITLEPVGEELVDAEELDKVTLYKKAEGPVAITDVTDSIRTLRATGTGGLATSASLSINKVTGKVTDQDGAPLPGVNILIKDSNIGTISDINGYYSLEVKEPGQSLVYSFIGFQSQEKNTAGRDQLDIQLQEDVSQLSEVVVKGRRPIDSEPAGDDNAVVKLAEPFGGRKAYDKYLETAKQYPQQAIERKVEGRVIIEFNVTTTGSLTGFSVLRGLGYGCEEEVIRLVKEGPKWSPSYIDDEAVESLVRVKMRFSLPK